MMFEGTYTAIVTPFRENGSIDYAALEELIEDQINGGVTGIVPVGTTGESPTLDFTEHHELIRFVVNEVRGKIQVIAGTGGNSTQEALELTKQAASAGADGTLQVTPYYNKPNQAGLLGHFTAVADIGLPVVLYNVPGRSGLELPLAVIRELAEHEFIVAVKEAGGKADRVSQIRQECDLTVLSGDDPLTLPMISVGAKGVISVASNIVPDVIERKVALALAGNMKSALEVHDEYYALFKALFMETNPIPVKTALAMMGKISETFRLPLAPMDVGQREELEQVLVRYNLI